METKTNISYIYFIIVINLVHNFWFVVKNVLKSRNITLPLNARGVILGIYEIYIENQNTINHIFYIFIILCIFNP